MNSKISLLLLLFSLLALTAYTNVGGLCSELKYLHVELMNAMLVGVFDMWIIFSPLIVRFWMVGMHTLLSVAKLCNRILGIRVYTLQSKLLRIAICQYFSNTVAPNIIFICNFNFSLVAYVDAAIMKMVPWVLQVFWSTMSSTS